MTDNRTRLVDAAQDSVQTSGLKGLSFRTLADEVGIKSSSVHYYFPEKADLAQALINRYAAAMTASLSDIASGQEKLGHKLESFISIFESVAMQNKICLCGMMAAEIEFLSEQNQHSLQQFFLDMENWLVTLLNAHSSQVKRLISTDALAKVMISGLEGALLMDKTAGNSDCMDAQKQLVLAMLNN